MPTQIHFEQNRVQYFTKSWQNRQIVAHFSSWKCYSCVSWPWPWLWV